MRAGLDTDRIAALYPDRHMDYFADVRWSGPLDEVLQDLAVQQLHANPGLRNVSADISVFASAYWLEIEVIGFSSGVFRRRVRRRPCMCICWRASATPADRHVLGRFEPDVHEAAADNRMSAIVDAYNRAADKALAEIAEGVARTLERSSSRLETLFPGLRGLDGRADLHPLRLQIRRVPLQIRAAHGDLVGSCGFAANSASDQGAFGGHRGDARLDLLRAVGAASPTDRGARRSAGFCGLRRAA